MAATVGGAARLPIMEMARVRKLLAAAPDIEDLIAELPADSGLAAPITGKWLHTVS
jgi:hypothetical protein